MKKLFVNDTFELGSYPQNIVVDTEITSAANRLCGTPSILSYALWNRYDNGECFGYTRDFEYGGRKYRCVYTEKCSRDGFLGINGYKKHTVYVFEYAPVVWRVVRADANTALAVSEKCLDVKPFCNGGLHARDKERYVDGAAVHMNNYKHSAIREWLNGEFFDTVFAAEEKARIATAEVNNGAETTKRAPNPYACENTTDNVFLLSYAEAATFFADNESRRKKATEYLKAQGGYAYATPDKKHNNSVWWLRSPDRNYCNCVRCVDDGGAMSDGGFSCANEPANSGEAVVPAITIIIKN